MPVVIVSNLTPSDVLIRDLGVVVPVSGQEILTNLFRPDIIAASRNLNTLVNDNFIVSGTSSLRLNDGVSNILQTNATAFLTSIPTVPSSGSNRNIILIPFIPPGSTTSSSVDSSENSSSYVVKARIVIDFGKFNLTGATLKGSFISEGYLSSTGGSKNGDIRIFNVTDATQLAVLNYVEGSATLKTVVLTTPLPTSGLKELSCEMRAGGATTLSCKGSAIMLSQEVN